MNAMTKAKLDDLMKEYRENGYSRMAMTKIPTSFKMGIMSLIDDHELMLKEINKYLETEFKLSTIRDWRCAHNKKSINKEKVFYEDEVKQKVSDELKAGGCVEEIAKKYKVNVNTVDAWHYRIKGGHSKIGRAHV